MTFLASCFCSTLSIGGTFHNAVAELLRHRVSYPLGTKLSTGAALQVPKLALLRGGMGIPTFEKTESDLDVLRSLLSDRLRHERGQLGLTQDQFAVRCGIAIRTYKRFELGECDSLDVFLKIVIAFERTRALDLLFPPKPTQARSRSPLGALAKLEQRRLKKQRPA